MAKARRKPIPKSQAEGLFKLDFGLDWFAREQRRVQRLGRLLRASLERQSPATPTPPVRKLSGKAWVPVAYARRADELLAMTITEASHALAKETSKPASDCAKPLNARYIETRLRELGTFPKARRNSSKHRLK